jgi:hypothetical protein
MPCTSNRRGPPHPASARTTKNWERGCEGGIEVGPNRVKKGLWNLVVVASPFPKSEQRTNGRLPARRGQRARHAGRQRCGTGPRGLAFGADSARSCSIRPFWELRAASAPSAACRNSSCCCRTDSTCARRHSKDSGLFGELAEFRGCPRRQSSMLFGSSPKWLASQTRRL